MDLSGKVAVVTGASKGLGKAVAELLSKEGCKVVVSARSETTQLASEIKGLSIEADVRNEKEMKELADKTIKKLGRIDIWINNAGVRIPNSKLEDIDWTRAHDMMEVNFFGTAYGSKAALKHMKMQKSGVIINILSTSALQGRPRLSAYVASKYAVRGFTDSLRNEIREDGITVIGVYPGGMKTNFFDEQMPEDYDKYMDPHHVAQKIIENLKSDKPKSFVLKMADACLKARKYSRMTLLEGS